MASLWLTSVPRGTGEVVATIKAIRQALRFFEPDAGMSSARATFEGVLEDGFAYLGEAAEDEFSVIRDALDQRGCGTAINLDPETYVIRRTAREMSSDGASPEEVFSTIASPEHKPILAQNGVQPTESAYKTAMMLMANCEGNPLKAASVAVGLARTTNSIPYYTEVVAAMILTFPWLEEMLKQQKLLA